MKKILAFAAALSLSMLSMNSFAQDKQIFNHLGVGITDGLDGIGLELVTTLTPYVQVRGGYSFLPLNATLKPSQFSQDIPTVEIGGKDRDISNMPVSLSVLKGGRGKLLFDIFPGKHTPFHFTAGLYIGSGSFFNAKADMREILDKEEWATTAITFNDISMSTDKNGYAYADIKSAVVMPYLGIGFGHALNVNNRVSVSFDMGVLYTGGLKPFTYNYLRSEKGEAIRITSRDLVDENGNQLDKGAVDMLGKIPVMPMLKLNVFFRIL